MRVDSGVIQQLLVSNIILLINTIKKRMILNAISTGKLLALNKPFTKVFPFGAYFSAESTEAMRIWCFVQEHNILMQPEIEPSIFVSRK